MGKGILYAAYGSNLNIGQMAQRCATARPVGKGRLEGWRLLFRGGHEAAVANVEAFEGGSVPVLLWELQGGDEAALDCYEGFPWLYRKETVAVATDTGAAEAMVYVMNEGRPLGQPSPHYYSAIREGYTSAGFDTEVLRQATVDSANGETGF